jgi:parallel beta-helix repeat protein
MRPYAWMAVALVCCASAVAMAGETMSVQGLLRSSDGVPLASGTYAMQFSLYTAASGGTAEWTETHSGDAAVTVTAGLYSAELGLSPGFPATLFSANPNLWLEVAVDVDGNATFEEVFAPRVKLTSAPYAHEAKNAAALEGQAASAFAPATHLHDAGDITTGELPDARIADDLSISSAGTVDGGAVKSGTVAEARVDSAIARDAEVATEIATHAGVANAHHTWPVTDAEVPDDITVSSAGSVDGGAVKSGIVAEPRIDAAIARVSQISPRQFDAVVALSGGDYTTIQAALAAGNKTIFVRNGTYVLTSDINITTSGTVIIGESRDGAIIDCNNTANGIKAIGDTAAYTAGTIAITNDTNTVTGTGTLWDANVSAGEYILLKGDLYKIQSVDSDTQLTLVETYQGRTVSGASYTIAAVLENIRLENLTVRGYNESSQAAIRFECVLNSIIRNCTANNNYDYGIWLLRSYHCKLNKNFARQNHYNGIRMDYSSHNALVENSCANNNFSGILLFYSPYPVISGNSCVNNDGSGIGLDNVAFSTLTGNCCQNNEVSGIEIYESNNCAVNGNVCENNGADGISIGWSDDCSVTGNSCRGNTSNGIAFGNPSDRNTLGLNSLTNNGAYGIDIYNSSCNNNVAIGNILYNNSSGAGNDAGTGTIKANNYPAF